MEITDKKLRSLGSPKDRPLKKFIRPTSPLWRHNWSFFPITGISCTVNIWKISWKELEMHISDVGMTGNLLRWSSTYECSDKKNLYIFSSPVFKILAVFMLEISIIIAADNFIWCLVSVQIVYIFYPIMSFQVVLREAVQVGYMQSNDWYTISPSLCTSLSASGRSARSSLVH